MKVLLVVGYDGSRFLGWQRQKNGRTVQKEIEDSISKVLGRCVAIRGVGRTDTGVHARVYPCSFEVTDELFVPADRFFCVLNAYLPEDIKALGSWRVSDDFDVRYGVDWKVYRYFIYSGIRNVLMDRWACFVPVADVELLLECCNAMNGKVDFSLFSCKDGRKKDVAGVIECSFHWQQEVGVGFIEVKSYGFLYKMVRRIVGLFLEILSGRYSVDVINAVKSGEKVNWMTAEAKGLWLWDVKFKGDEHGIAKRLMLCDRAFWL